MNSFQVFLGPVCFFPAPRKASLGQFQISKTIFAIRRVYV